MTPPRYFYPLVAACLVVLTIAATYALVARTGVGRYIRLGTIESEIVILDTKTGQFCTLGEGHHCSPVPVH